MTGWHWWGGGEREGDVDEDRGEEKGKEEGREKVEESRGGGEVEELKVHSRRVT